MRARISTETCSFAGKLALGVFLFVADPSGGRNDAPLGHWLTAGCACAVVSGALLISFRTARPGSQSGAAGHCHRVLFGLVAAWTKSVGHQVENGVLQVFTPGHL